MRQIAKKRTKGRKIRFDIFTIFPKIFDSYFGESIIRRAVEKKSAEIHAHNIRDFAGNKHNTVDEKPYGGGAGMVLTALPRPSRGCARRKVVSERREKEDSCTFREGQAVHAETRLGVVKEIYSHYFGERPL